MAIYLRAVELENECFAVQKKKGFFGTWDFCEVKGHSPDYRRTWSPSSSYLFEYCFLNGTEEQIIMKLENVKQAILADKNTKIKRIIKKEKI